jgi:hypothetical protein
MEDKVDSLRKMYEGFRRGKMEAEAVRDEERARTPKQTI